VPRPRPDDRDRYPDEEDHPPVRRRFADLAPHRGVLILVLGLCAFLVFPVPFGQIAWYLGSCDLAEIRAGRMDPEGEGMTQIGRILGMISTIFLVVGVLGLCLLFGVIGLAASKA
jgi:hypothetical protein